MQFVYQDPLRPWEKVLVAVAWHNEPAKSPTYPSPRAIRWITLGTVGWTPRNHQHASVQKYSYPQTTSTLPCFLAPGLLPRFCLTFQLWDCQTPCRGGTIMETEALPSIDGERVGVVTKGQFYFFHEAKTCRTCKQTVLGLEKEFQKHHPTVLLDKGSNNPRSAFKYNNRFTSFYSNKNMFEP